MYIVNFCTFPLGIEAQLLSQKDIDQGIDVTFPMVESNISVKSEVPNTILSMYKYLNSVNKNVFATEEFPGPVTNTFLANSFLPNNFDGYVNNEICSQTVYNVNFVQTRKI